MHAQHTDLKKEENSERRWNNERTMQIENNERITRKTTQTEQTKRRKNREKNCLLKS